MFYIMIISEIYTCTTAHWGARIVQSV